MMFTKLLRSDKSDYETHQEEISKNLKLAENLQWCLLSNDVDIDYIDPISALIRKWEEYRGKYLQADYQYKKSLSSVKLNVNYEKLDAIYTFISKVDDSYWRVVNEKHLGKMNDLVNEDSLELSRLLDLIEEREVYMEEVTLNEKKIKMKNTFGTK